jgi:cyclic pyranopterin phosphate synthase
MSCYLSVNFKEYNLTDKDEKLLFTHLDENNMPKMVDVSDKKITNRIAIASGDIFMSEDAFRMIVANKTKKGPVLQTAIISAIMGAKQTSNLIPMCHPLDISSIKCDTKELEYGFNLSVKVKTSGKTGIEMEALTAVSIGLLTIYDMVKAIDKTMKISNIQLNYKSGGKSGEFINE